MSKNLELSSIWNFTLYYSYSSDEVGFEDMGRNADLYIFNQDDRQD